MTRQEFWDALQDIVAAFGEKRYPKVILERLFSELSPIPAEIFARRMRDVLMTSKGAPTAAEIRIACFNDLLAAKDQRKRAAIEALMKSGRSCHHCDLTGLIFATSNKPEDRGAEFSFRCGKCPAATTRGIHMLVPIWNAATHGAKFTLRDFGSNRIRASNAKIQGVMQQLKENLGIKEDYRADG